MGTTFACSGALAISATAIYRRKVNSLRGKVVLITGGSRGLGLAMAEEMGRRGAKLALTARKLEELERARELLLERRVMANIEDIVIVPGDLSKQEHANEVVQQILRRFGRIDILVNNAGIITVGPLENQTVEDFNQVVRRQLLFPVNDNYFSLQTTFTAISY